MIPIQVIIFFRAANMFYLFQKAALRILHECFMDNFDGQRPAMAHDRRYKGLLTHRCMATKGVICNCLESYITFFRMDLW